MQRQFPCPLCGNPLSRPHLVQNFVFAEDLEATMDLFEGRFNSVNCPLCKKKISFQVAVIVMNYDEKAILGMLPRNAQESEEAKLYALAEQNGFRLKICHDYDELKQAAVGWIDRYFVPIGSKLISDDIERLSPEQMVSLVTPFFLRVFKASLDSYLPLAWQLSGASPEQAYLYAEEFYHSILLEHLVHLRTLVVTQGKFDTLITMIDRHVPRVCLTVPILKELSSRCSPLVDPEADPQGFIRGYLDEYLCAAAHACAGVSNPRGANFASYLAHCWYLSRRKDVVFDDRMLLSNPVIHRLIRFEDLWDLLTYRLPDTPISPEEIVEVFALLEDFGYQTEFHQLRHGILKITDADGLTQQVREQIKNTLLEKALENFPLSSSPEDSESYGGVVASAAAHLLRNQLREQAFAMLDQALQIGKEADDPVAIISICANAIEILCENLLYERASDLAREALEFLNDDRVFDRPSLLIQIWNGIGNVSRYRRQRKKALKAYQFVEQINEVAPIEEAERAKNRLTFRRNIGIIYREMGDYRSALEILKSASEKAPKDAGLLHNLAILYVDLNRYEDALRCLDQAIEMASGDVHATERSRYLSSRSEVKLAVGEVEAGLRDLRDAYRNISSDNISFRGALAAQALSFYPHSPEGQQFVVECQTLVKRLIMEEDYADEALATAYLRGAFCIRLLRDMQVEAARKIFVPHWKWIEATGTSYDWKTVYIRGWLQYVEYEDERCWPFLMEAAQKIDLILPTGSNVQFAPFWIQDKGEFQDLLASVALDLTERGLLPAEELLGVYEFMNGREISARILGEEAAKMNSGSAILARCTSHPRALERNLKVFLFIETAHEVRLACLDARDETVRLLDLPGINVRDLGALKFNLRQAFRKANPADMPRLDKKLARWEDLSRRLGAAVAPHLQPDAHICFLPGRAFTGLPLHLLAMPDSRRLVEWNTVGLAPNFTVLLEVGVRQARELKDSLVIVTVTKAADGPEFKQNALKASLDLMALLEPRTPINWLQEHQADLAAVKKVLGESSEAIFLCHGTTAGQDKGYGICIAAGGLLPPTILSVREVPEHLRFILNWEDIELSPPTFVSIGCSSGITELAKGGVRFGLEQTLFSGGTTHIISPLWDVNQESSLCWVQAFYRARQSEPACSLEEAHQHACLETRQLYPHYYFWGPFMMNGAL
jgi:tetratricopeptide (TPR) repeat protein